MSRYNQLYEKDREILKMLRNNETTGFFKDLEQKVLDNVGRFSCDIA